MLNMCVTEEVTLQTELKLPEQLLMTLSTKAIPHNPVLYFKTSEDTSSLLLLRYYTEYNLFGGLTCTRHLVYHPGYVPRPGSLPSANHVALSSAGPWQPIR